MLIHSSSFKPRPKTNADIAAQYINTYQPESIRKSTNNNHPALKQQPILKKEKTYRKVNTEADEPLPIQQPNKYVSKGLRLASKGTSPVLKKTLITESSPSSKLCFSNNAGKIKRVKKSSNGEKAITETGPIIQRTLNYDSQKHPLQNQKEKEKVVFFIPEEKSFMESKKENYFSKKGLESKSNANLYMKARMHTEGTVDSTPTMINSYDIQLIEIIGQGTFGKVYKGIFKRTGETVAVKKVFQDPKYKNRQIQIVNMLKGEFVMKVLGSYTTFEQGSQYLNIVMSYYQGDLYSLIRQNGKKGLTTMDIKIMSYQIFRGLLFIHQLKIAHRDIKPHNVLYKGKKVAICDFGSAKILTNEPNLPYICSRCYRAPQLIFGATHYTSMIDIWSVGCVLLEMIQGTPLFIGESSVDHLIEIIKVLGTPTKSQVIDMNPNYDLNDYKFPKVKKREWNKIFPKTDPLLLDLISQIMIYSPKQRLNAAEALAHEFYDQIRQQAVYRMIQKQSGLSLFSFYPEELKGHEHLIPKLVPSWHRQFKEHHHFL